MSDVPNEEQETEVERVNPSYVRRDDPEQFAEYVRARGGEPPKAEG